MKTRVPRETGDASEAGPAFCLLGCLLGGLLGCAAAVGAGLAARDGLIVGKRAAALPGPTDVLASPLRDGMGPSGSTGRFRAKDGGLADFEGLADFGGTAAVTAVVWAAAGGVHCVVVTTLAVAVSFTELTEVAFDATAILACKMTGCSVVTEPTLHEAVPSPSAQPLLNTGFWLDGCAVSATDTSEADPFWVETFTM